METNVLMCPCVLRGEFYLTTEDTEVTEPDGGALLLKAADQKQPLNPMLEH